LKRIVIAFLGGFPVFRGAWHPATAGAIFHLHQEAEHLCGCMFNSLVKNKVADRGS
jgi:hypothetical protein